MNKNPLLYLLSCIYRHYYFVKSTKDIAYDYSLGILTAFLQMNIATILILFGVIMPGEEDKNVHYVNFLIYVLFPGLCIFLFLRYILTPEKKLKEMDIFSRNDDTDYFYIISYVVLSTGSFIYVLLPYWHSNT